MRHTFRYLVAAPPEPGARVALGPDDAHHCRRVVRRGVGDEVELIDGAGGCWAATVVEASGERVVVEAGAPRPVPELAPVRLAVGLLDSARLDMVVEKAAELGVRELAVVGTARVRRTPADRAWERRLERLERIVASAVRQSGRGRLTAVRGLVPFAAIVAETPAAMGILIDPAGTDPFAGALARAAARAGGPEPLTVLVGPEAGFAREEVAAAADAGWAVCGMGPAVLRAETAAIAAAALAATATGHLGGA